MVKTVISVTCPWTVRTSMYSPTRNGRVKRMVSPANTFPSTPWSAKPAPTPATPTPAMSEVTGTPIFSAATTTVAAMIMARKIRTTRARRETSSAFRISHASSSAPVQRATRKPMNRMISAPTTWNP